MILERTEHPDWLTNAYLLADRAQGSAVLVDGNDRLGPLVERIEADGLDLAAILVTHHHGDHVAGVREVKERFGVPVLAHADAAALIGPGLVDRTVADDEVLRFGDLELRALLTPGHAAGHLALLVDGTDCLTADVIFKGTVGGTRGPGATGFEDLRRSIMERVLTLPGETRLHPGHREPTTVAEEWEANPFVRVWRGLDPEGAEPCRVRGEEATLVLWGPDYDGTNKAWVRFPGGEQAVVGGSQVER